LRAATLATPDHLTPGPSRPCRKNVSTATLEKPRIATDVNIPTCGIPCQGTFGVSPRTVDLPSGKNTGKRLTAAGARLAAKAAGILEGARRLKEDVAGEPEVPRGPVRVGAREVDQSPR